MENSLYQPTSSQCYTIFCGCETIRDPYDTEQQSVTVNVYIYIAVILAIIMGSIKLSMQWFIFKDYFPLKQKSPILCILMIFSIAVQLLIYPVIYTTNFFTRMFNNPQTRFKFRAIQIGFQFSVYFIYLVRCLRIWYAHETHTSRKKSLAFRVFQRQDRLAMSIMTMVLFKGLFVFIQPYIFDMDSRSYDFAMSFQIAAVTGSPSNEHYFVVRNLISNFIWQILLAYCLWLQKTINYRYSMKRQLMLIVGITQLINIFYIISLAATINSTSIMHQLCTRYFPMTQFWKYINLIVALVVSICLPLRQKRTYHVLLPTGPHYGFTKTMRNFLMERQFLNVFSKYLEHLDEQQQTTYYSKLLKFWKQMLTIKIDGKRQTEQQKLEDIKSLITDAQSDIFLQHQELINSLKGTILGIQQEEVQTEYSQLRKIKYRQSINEKVDQLEDIALDKLNKIYVQKYYFTQSYLYLRQIMNDYKKVNLNLIMLNMALIVDSENEFT